MNQNHSEEIQEERRSSGLDHKRQSDGKIEVILPGLRESVLPKVFPLSDVTVLFPEARTSLFQTVMYYKINFKWNGEEKSITKRFSEVDKLRENLQTLLPFTYVYPLHKKQLLVILKEHVVRGLSS